MQLPSEHFKMTQWEFKLEVNLFPLIVKHISFKVSSHKINYDFKGNLNSYLKFVPKKSRRQSSMNWCHFLGRCMRQLTWVVNLKTVFFSVFHCLTFPGSFFLFFFSFGKVGGWGGGSFFSDPWRPSKRLCRYRFLLPIIISVFFFWWLCLSQSMMEWMLIGSLETLIAWVNMLMTVNNSRRLLLHSKEYSSFKDTAPVAIF